MHFMASSFEHQDKHTVAVCLINLGHEVRRAPHLHVPLSAAVHMVRKHGVAHVGRKIGLAVTSCSVSSIAVGSGFGLSSSVGMKAVRGGGGARGWV